MANKIGLFFGSSTGNTEAVAYNIKDEFNNYPDWEVEVHNIGASTPEQLLSYSYLILGVPTWNVGQMQDDWEIFLPRFAEMDLTGKKVAIFGLGDQNGYGFNFLDAAGMLADEVLVRGANLMGLWPIKSYEFEESRNQMEDHFMTLGVDQEGQADMTPKRVKEWVKQVHEEFSGMFDKA